MLYTVGLVLSSLVGLLHFFAPYAFAWYSYIPDAPLEIYASIDYINFLFSLLLTGLSLILLCFTHRAFEGSSEVLDEARRTSPVMLTEFPHLGRWSV